MTDMLKTGRVAHYRASPSIPRHREQLLPHTKQGRSKGVRGASQSLRPGWRQVRGVAEECRLDMEVLRRERRRC